jgi:hypothetical protein
MPVVSYVLLVHCRQYFSNYDLYSVSGITETIGSVHASK